jgi:glycosyltransferase involved in cell wall biosynthesis
MKRIIILSGNDCSERSGLNVVSLNYAKALHKRGMEVSIFGKGSATQSISIEDIIVNTFKYLPGNNSFLNFVRTYAACRKGWRFHYAGNEPNIFHGHDYLTYFFLMRLLSGRVKKIFTVHDPLVYHQMMLGNITEKSGFKKSLFKYIEKRVHKESDAIHVISQYTADRFCYRPLKTDCLPKVVYNWIDMDRFVLPTDKSQVRALLGITDEEFIVFSLRRLEPRMGLENLIQGFAKACARMPNSRLIIGGKGPLMRPLISLANNLGLNNISFLDFVPDAELVSWYQSADVVVMPSLDGEGFGLPIIEAMACGVPVLGTPVCAIPEVLFEKKERLFSGTRPEEIANGLVRFYGSWKSGEVAPESERQYVLDHFSEEKRFPLVLEDYFDY